MIPVATYAQNTEMAIVEISERHHVIVGSINIKSSLKGSGRYRCTASIT